MRIALVVLSLLGSLLLARQSSAEPLSYIGQPVRGFPVSSAVREGKSVFVSGMPAFDSNGNWPSVNSPRR